MDKEQDLIVRLLCEANMDLNKIGLNLRHVIPALVDTDNGPEINRDGDGIFVVEILPDKFNKITKGGN